MNWNNADIVEDDTPIDCLTQGNQAKTPLRWGLFYVANPFSAGFRFY